MSSEEINIAIAGVGTVGKGLLELIEQYKNNKININIKAVASRRKQKFEGSLYKKTKFFDNAHEFLNFNDYDVLVELIGGDQGVSKTIVFDALKKKKKRSYCQQGISSKILERN